MGCCCCLIWGLYTDRKNWWLFIWFYKKNDLSAIWSWNVANKRRKRKNNRHHHHHHKHLFSDFLKILWKKVGFFDIKIFSSESIRTIFYHRPGQVPVLSTTTERFSSFFFKSKVYGKSKPREKKTTKNQCFQISNHTHTHTKPLTDGDVKKKIMTSKINLQKKEKKIDQPPIHIYYYYTNLHIWYVDVIIIIIIIFFSREKNKKKSRSVFLFTIIFLFGKIGYLSSFIIILSTTATTTKKGFFCGHICHSLEG